MDDFANQAFAHLNVHDRLLQFAFSGMLAQMSREDAKALCAKLRAQARAVGVPADADPEFLEQSALSMLRDSADLLESFLLKAQATADEIRAQAPR